MDKYIVIAEGVIGVVLFVSLIILTSKHKNFIREKELRDAKEKSDYLNEMLENKVRKSL